MLRPRKPAGPVLLAAIQISPAAHTPIGRERLRQYRSADRSSRLKHLQLGAPRKPFINNHKEHSGLKVLSRLHLLLIILRAAMAGVRLEVLDGAALVQLVPGLGGGQRLDRPLLGRGLHKSWS